MNRLHTFLILFMMISHTTPAQTGNMTTETRNGALTISKGQQELLRYQFATAFPPAGIDTNYKRSGFIHPLWTPNGQVLTRIQPADHYHHYGIWNPWTHTLFENDTVDFWNLAKKQGTVRFVKMGAVKSDALQASYETLHEHVVFKKDGSEKVALNEWQTVTVYAPTDNKQYYVDIVSKFQCASASPLLLLTYRYGGFGWRTTEVWDNKNSEILTSEGKTRKDADGSLAKWCLVQGSLGNDYGGMVLLSHPGNYNHPEPLRIWPEDQYGRGDLFVNVSPTKNKDWLLEPGKTYILKYRLVVFNGKFDMEKAEREWQSFSQRVPREIKPNN
jgi:hypothetical protein